MFLGGGPGGQSLPHGVTWCPLCPPRPGCGAPPSCPTAGGGPLPWQWAAPKEGSCHHDNELPKEEGGGGCHGDGCPALGCAGAWRLGRTGTRAWPPRCQPSWSPCSGSPVIRTPTPEPGGPLSMHPRDPQPGTLGTLCPCSLQIPVPTPRTLLSLHPWLLPALPAPGGGNWEHRPSPDGAHLLWTLRGRAGDLSDPSTGWEPQSPPPSATTWYWELLAECRGPVHRTVICG